MSQGTGTLGERLKLARKRAGLSLRGLATRLEGRVTAQAIGKYERNEMKPSAPVLDALAQSLGRPLGYFTDPVPMALGGVAFRRHGAGLGARERIRIEAAVVAQVQRHLTLEAVLALDSGAERLPVSRQRPRTGASTTGDEAGETLAGQVRQAWDLGGEPIPNLTRVLERHGIQVLLLELPEGMAGLACQVGRLERSPVPCIVVDPTTDHAHRRIALAGELAHLLVEPRSTIDVDAVAYRFVTALLLPAAHVQAEIGAHRRAFGVVELDQLSSMYGVSAAMVLLRCEQLGILAPARGRRALQAYEHTEGWTEPWPLVEADASLEVPHRFERLCHRAIAEGLIETDGWH